MWQHPALGADIVSQMSTQQPWMSCSALLRISGLHQLSYINKNCYRATLHIARTMLSQDVRCPSVCLSHAGILSTWLNISSNVFIIGFYFPTPNGMAIFRRGPLTGASNARGIKKSPFSVALYPIWNKIEP